jgi:hypothetical protein
MYVYLKGNGPFLAEYEDVYQAARYVLLEKMVVGFMDDMEYSCKVKKKGRDMCYLSI